MAREAKRGRGRPALGRSKVIVSFDPEDLETLDGAEVLGADRSSRARALVKAWAADDRVRESVARALKARAAT